MMPLIATMTLFISPQFCAEIIDELNEAVKRGQFEKSVAADLSNRCLQACTRGASCVLGAT